MRNLIVVIKIKLHMQTIDKVIGVGIVADWEGEE